MSAPVSFFLFPLFARQHEEHTLSTTTLKPPTLACVSLRSVTKIVSTQQGMNIILLELSGFV